MEKKQDYLLALMVVLFSISISFSQSDNISGHNKSGKIYYKSGNTEEGKLSFNKRTLSIKYADKSKKKVDIKKVEKFAVYHKKKDSLYYTFVLSKRNAKSEKKYLCELVFDGKNVKIYNEPTTAGKVSIVTIYQAVYFIQKEGEPYAVKLVKAFKNINTQMKEHFKDCPSLTEKIGTKGYKLNDIAKIAEYYETNCAKKERKKSTEEKVDVSEVDSEQESKVNPEEKRANQISAREAKKKALEEKKKKVLEERAKRVDSIRKAREK